MLIVQKYDKTEMEEILRHMLAEEFLSFFEIDLPQIKHIQIFVKTTNEFVWGDRFGVEDAAYDYLEDLGYTKIHITAAKEIHGGWLNESIS